VSVRLLVSISYRVSEDFVADARYNTVAVGFLTRGKTCCSGGLRTIVNTFSGTASVPEPATITLLGIGLVGLVGVRGARRFKGTNKE
jgi:hypothetical protein